LPTLLPTLKIATHLLFAYPQMNEKLKLIKKYKQVMNNQFIVLKTGREKYTRVCVDEIICFLAEGNYTIVKTETRNEILLSSNLKNTLEKINNENLIKINRSTVINYKKVLDFSVGKKPLIKLINKDTFTPTKTYIENIKEKIINTGKGSTHTDKV